MKEHGVIGKPVTAKKEYQCSREGGTADGTAAKNDTTISGFAGRALTGYASCV